MPDFRFSLPQITDLTEDQQVAYYPRKSILVSGGPGSGKTVVTIYRFLRGVLEENKNMLFTFNNALIFSIKGTLRARAEELFGDLDEEKIHEVINQQLSTFYQWHKDNVAYYNVNAELDVVERNFKHWAANNDRFDELFFDEGQDLPATIYKSAHLLSETVSVGADRAQNYRGHYAQDAAEEDIFEAMDMNLDGTEWQILKSNFRNTKEVFELAKLFVPTDLRVLRMDTSGLRRGNTPDIRTGLSRHQQLALILQIIEANQASNIGILLHFAHEVISFKDFMVSNGYSCTANATPGKSFSYYCKDILYADEIALRERVSSPFITTFDSCKGLEFDIVIMPFFDTSRVATTGLNNSGRPWVTANHYYVGVTRAKNEIYILSYSIPPALSFHIPAR